MVEDRGYFSVARGREGAPHKHRPEVPEQKRRGGANRMAKGRVWNGFVQRLQGTHREGRQKIKEGPSQATSREGAQNTALTSWPACRGSIAHCAVDGSSRPPHTTG